MTPEDSAYLIVGCIFSLLGIPLLATDTYAVLTLNNSLMRFMFPLSIGVAGLCLFILALGTWLDAEAP